VFLRWDWGTERLDAAPVNTGMERRRPAIGGSIEEETRRLLRT
jgi:hypothetical protein